MVVRQPAPKKPAHRDMSVFGHNIKLPEKNGVVSLSRVEISNDVREILGEELLPTDVRNTPISSLAPSSPLSHLKF